MPAIAHPRLLDLPPQLEGFSLTGNARFRGPSIQLANFAVHSILIPDSAKPPDAATPVTKSGKSETLP